MVNNATISGNLCRDIEVRRTQSGFAIGEFSVAVNERVKNSQSGEYEDYANFIDCKLLGKRCESLERYLVKGTKATVQGRLHQERWESKEGKKMSKLILIVDDLEFMSRGDGNDGGGRSTGGRPKAAPVVDSSVYDEDIPF